MSLVMSKLTENKRRKGEDTSKCFDLLKADASPPLGLYVVASQTL